MSEPLKERIVEIIWRELRADPFGSRNQLAVNFADDLAELILKEIERE